MSRAKIKLIAADIEDFKQDNDEFPNGTISGHAAVFNVLDRQNDVIEPNAFDQDIATFKKGKAKFPLMDSHNVFDSAAVIGRVYELDKDRKGLTFSAFFGSSEIAARIRQQVKEGLLDSLSIGFRILKDRLTSAGVRIIEKIELREISIVNFPANEAATITGVKLDDPGFGYQALMNVCRDVNHEYASLRAKRRKNDVQAAMESRLLSLERMVRRLDRLG